VTTAGNTTPAPIAIAPDLWIVDGPVVRFLGMPYPTRMTIVRLRDGALWICSPIVLTAPLRSALDALGAVAYLVAPNKLHHLFLGDWTRAYPGAALWAAPGLARRRSDLAFAGTLGDRPEPGWAADLDQVLFHSLAMDEVVFFHRASRTVVVTDLVQRFDPATVRGWRGLVMRADGLVGEGGSTPREWRLTFVDRRRARAGRRRVLAWNPERVVVAHGTCVATAGRAVLARALRWMGRD
jgi:hypothetical protein